MPAMLSRLSAIDVRARAPILLLALALSLTAVLGWEAVSEARSHQRVAERAVKDYTGIAAWALAARVNASLEAVQEALASARDNTPSQLFAALSENADCDCGRALLAVVHIATSPTPRVIDRYPQNATLPSALDEVVYHWPEGEDLDRDTGMLMVTTDSQPVVVIYAAQPARAGIVVAAVWSSARLVTALVENAVAGAPLLPRTLTNGIANTDAVAVVLESARGDTLYTSPLGSFSLATIEAKVPLPANPAVRSFQRESLPGVLAHYTAGVALRRNVIAHLSPEGGGTGRRGAYVLGILALAVALVAVAMHQVQRQQELARLRSDFVSGVSHELRTPLAQIRLFADLLESERLTLEQRRRAGRIINEESQRLAWLVDNVLRFSALERAPAQLRPRPADLAVLVDEVVESFAPLARSHGAHLERVGDARVPGVADRDALRQVLLNLLDNAVKYGPAGQRIRVGAESIGSNVRIWVDDQGPGIPPEERVRVFEPFRRMRRDAQSATGGSGIGLAVVRQLVSLHGGTTEIFAAPGGGARVRIELPTGYADSRSIANTPTIAAAV